MAEYKPYEAPQYMQDYAQTATDPFGRSLLGQKLAMEKLEEMTDTNYEEPINASMPDSGLPEEAGVAEESGIADILGDIAIYGGTRTAGTQLIKKGLLNKLAAKGITRGAGYLVPGAGQVMLGADALDFLLPEGYSPYEGFGLAPNNPLSNLMSMGNLSDFTGGEQ